MKDLSDSWKDDSVFFMQLSLNINELSSKDKYPAHWIDFINLIKMYNPKSMLDVGCGCGAYYELCKKEFLNVEYIGIDYSEQAINLARKTWNADVFFQKDYRSLTRDYLSKFDLVHLGGLLDVLSNGDEALEFILNNGPKNVLIGRMKFSNGKSYYKTYLAYNKIETYMYYHDKNIFLNICSKYSYKINNLGNSYYLSKIEDIL
jgi:trans-aconitate methyltransferase